MLQAIGLTSTPRRARPPAVDDLTFEARPGTVTALLGAPGSGKTTVLRLMLGLERGRGVTYFRGRPLHRVAHPAREVGALLGDVPGNPSRTARAQLRMLCAAAGVPAARADSLLDVVGLTGLGGQRLGNLSLGMDRRLGLASALLADPHTLLLDEPAAGLSPRDSSWLHGLLRSHAAHGGTVLYTTDDAKEAARTADRVVSLDEGRLVADQAAADFARTRLRPRVAVRTPQAVRLGALLSKEARVARRSVEVVSEEGNRLSVYGSTCAEVGDTAFRHGVPLHQLADETGDMGPGRTPAQQTPVTPRDASRARLADARRAPLPGGDRAPLADGSRASLTSAGRAPLAGENRAPLTGGDRAPLADGSRASLTSAGRAPLAGENRAPSTGADRAPSADGGRIPLTGEDRAPLAGDPATPPVTRPVAASHRDSTPLRPLRGPLRPFRYEVLRTFSTRSTFLVALTSLVASAVLCVLAVHAGGSGGSLPVALAAWPALLPLPPAAFAAGLLGALSFGDEFRYPALAASRGTSPRHLGLLLAKLAVSAGLALLLAALTVGVNLLLVRLLYGAGATPLPASGLPGKAASWAALSVGCAWAGVLGAGVFRVATAGLAAVLAVPVAVAPVVQHLLSGPAARSTVGLPGRLRELTWIRIPAEADQWLLAAMRIVAQPVGTALALSLPVLLCTYLITDLRRKARW
ncbi:ATP-binding cassette domain-containing protein [Streptomyces sp. NPDC088745]|uniref:ATP-binding cassette domain-containing protein n=1 Tax=Streptomyces sp. NPDC088745 TaxID=3365884 RepID=UPI0037F7D081